jgi:hypothetical protein
MQFLFFFNGKYINNKNHVSEQDEQWPEKEGLQNINEKPIKIPKQTSPNRDPLLISFLKGTP